MGNFVSHSNKIYSLCYCVVCVIVHLYGVILSVLHGTKCYRANVSHWYCCTTISTEALPVTVGMLPIDFEVKDYATSSTVLRYMLKYERKNFSAMRRKIISLLFTTYWRVAASLANIYKGASALSDLRICLWTIGKVFVRGRSQCHPISYRSDKLKKHIIFVSPSWRIIVQMFNIWYESYASWSKHNVYQSSN